MFPLFLLCYPSGYLLTGIGKLYWCELYCVTKPSVLLLRNCKRRNKRFRNLFLYDYVYLLKWKRFKLLGNQTHFGGVCIYLVLFIMVALSFWVIILSYSVWGLPICRQKLCWQKLLRKMQGLLYYFWNQLVVSTRSFIFCFLLKFIYFIL